MDLVPIARPTTAAATTNTSHPVTAALRCWELHRPASAARFHRFSARGILGSSAGWLAVLIAGWLTTPPLALQPLLPARFRGLVDPAHGPRATCASLGRWAFGCVLASCAAFTVLGPRGANEGGERREQPQPAFEGKGPPG